jgi:hypothetical protein
MNVQLVPGDNAQNPITIPGTSRKYSGSLGSLTSVVDFDALILRNAGWVAAVGSNSGAGSGPTSGRPAYPAISPGYMYVDTSLNVVATYVGPKGGWVNAATGASV